MDGNLLLSTDQVDCSGSLFRIGRHPSSLGLGADLRDEIRNETSPVGFLVVDVALAVGLRRKEGVIELVCTQVSVAKSLAFLNEGVVHRFVGLPIHSAATDESRGHFEQIEGADVWKGEKSGK